MRVLIAAAIGLCVGGPAGATQAAPTPVLAPAAQGAVVVRIVAHRSCIIWPGLRLPGARGQCPQQQSLDLNPELPPVPLAFNQRIKKTPQHVGRLRFSLQWNNASGDQPEVEKLQLFAPEYGIHGYSRRFWLSEHIGIQGGIGYAGKIDMLGGLGLDQINGSDVAVGLGVTWVF